MSRTDQVNFDVNAKFIFDLFICFPLNRRGSALRFTLALLMNNENSQMLIARFNWMAETKFCVFGT